MTVKMILTLLVVLVYCVFVSKYADAVLTESKAYNRFGPIRIIGIAALILLFFPIICLDFICDFILDRALFLDEIEEDEEWDK